MYTEKIIGKCVEYLDNEDREILYQCKECVGDVTACHENIHFHTTEKEYNCTDSMAEYVAKYFPRYVTEIRDILDIINISYDKEEIDVLSIGNGPSSDLYAFLDQRGDQSSKIKYCGIDMNPNWDYINKITEKEILATNSNCEVSFETGDVFEEIKNFNCSEGEVLPHNFLIFQYVISAMTHDPNTTKKDIENFLDKIIDQIVAKMPENSYIIFNDINHNTDARDYFEYFLDKVAKVAKGVYWRRHYFNAPWQYGYCHNHSRVRGEYNNKYDKRGYCSSSQLIIKKEFNK